MKNRHNPLKFYTIALISIIALNIVSLYANEPDSAYIFAYTTTKNHGKNGLHIAWSIDKENWHSIGPEYRFLTCDYGRWGAEKKMFSPFLFRDRKKLWHCIWSVNDYDGVFAHASSLDLINWKPQSYPGVMIQNNCLDPEVVNDKKSGYRITWISTKTKDTLVYSNTTTDFKNYTPSKELSKDKKVNGRIEIEISHDTYKGTIHIVSWDEIDNLIKAQQLSAYHNQLKDEHFNDDPVHFSEIKPVEATITADISDSKKISDMLMGIFFEDINYAADGGLYAELVQNRDFEYNLMDKLGRDPSWIATKAWSLTDSVNSKLDIDTVSPLHINNKHYAILNVSKVGAGLANTGYSGIYIKSGEKYDFSAFIRNKVKNEKNFIIRLTGKDGRVVGESSVTVNADTWQKAETVITANETVTDARLEVVPQFTGRIDLDMISLFPQNTFKGRKNGLRDDLAQTIADLNPRFVRFPGGCVVHGDGLANIYKWKNTIGPLEARKPQPNIWRYHQSFGLGFFEYFQFCEDIGAEAVPVIAAGVPCQNSSTGGAGQQGGVPLSDMDQFIQDILDLIEYCNGGVNTTWGQKRADAGHPEPFNLKYIGIGNEDLISDIFKERFEMIYNVINEKYPEIIVIGTVGPFSEGSDYTEGWKFATDLGLELVDEHYYQGPGWFINNQDYYDRYDRNKSKVYLGEYASWGNKLYNALAEAIYLTAIERNGDVVRMASYAPLLAKNGATRWRTDLIFFNNSEIYLTPNYEIQKLYGQNSGDFYIKSNTQLSDNNNAIRKRIGVSAVRDSNTGDVILKMVNILPVEINTNLDIKGLNGIESKASKIVLSGNRDDRSVTPVNTTIEAGNQFNVVLPAYSFTLIRLKNSKR